MKRDCVGGTERGPLIQAIQCGGKTVASLLFAEDVLMCFVTWCPRALYIVVMGG